MGDVIDIATKRWPTGRRALEVAETVRKLIAFHFTRVPGICEPSDPAQGIADASVVAASVAIHFAKLGHSGREEFLMMMGRLWNGIYGPDDPRRSDADALEWNP